MSCSRGPTARSWHEHQRRRRRGVRRRGQRPARATATTQSSTATSATVVRTRLSRRSIRCPTLAPAEQQQHDPEQYHPRLVPGEHSEQAPASTASTWVRTTRPGPSPATASTRQPPAMSPSPAGDFGAIYLSTPRGTGLSLRTTPSAAQAPNAGGGPLTVTGSALLPGMRLSVGTTTATSVQGNTIRNLSITTTSGSTIHGAISCRAARSTSAPPQATRSVARARPAASPSPARPAQVFSGIVTGSGTPGVVAISNNTVGGITMPRQREHEYGAFRGIFAQGTSYQRIPIVNNTIGSATTADSVTQRRRRHGVWHRLGVTRPLPAA